MACTEPFLYYLDWRELVPTYGTAWLFLAVPSIPISALAGWALSRLNGRAKWSRLSTWLKWSLDCVAATILVAALGGGFVSWLRTFSFLARSHATTPLLVTSVAVGLLIGFTRAGRAALLNLYSSARMITVIGALSLLSLPFSGWGTVPAAGAPQTPIEQPRPHVVLVTIDTLSAPHMSLYGAARRTTPEIDAFADEATVFDHAYANGNFTTPGIASIVTGTRPWTHRALQLHAWPVDVTRRQSLPALLKEAGYQTAYVGTSPWAGAARNGLGPYFSFGVPDAVTNVSLCRDRLAAIFPYACPATELAPFIFAAKIVGKVRDTFFDQPPNWQFDPKTAIRPALAWLGSVDKSKPVFLWLHLLPPHSPYAAPAPWLTEFDSSTGARSAATSESSTEFLFKDIGRERAKLLEARYDESIKYVDHFVGQFLQQSLQALGENTIVVVTSDHGESFSHDYGMHGGPGLYESIIHIPLVIKFPHQRQGVRESVAAEQVDIAPTVAQLAKIAPGSTWEGKSLSARGGEGSIAADPVFAMDFEESQSESRLTTGSVAVIDGNWKFVQYMGALRYPLMPKLGDELYELSVDPQEHKNLAAEHPDEADRLRGLIAAQLRQHGGALR